MIFRRPELEKDNPIAPQPYIGPRRRLAMARAAAESTETDDVRKTLRVLTEAAARMVDRLPSVRKGDKDLRTLRHAIAHAERVLSAEDD